jgi:CubicO group peptidase (beta-lactamase class C family)
MQPSSHHLLQSASKSLTVSLLAILMEQGKITPNTKVEQYVPQLSKSGYANAQVSHLMDMLSGVSYSTDMSIPESEVNRHMQSYLWKPRSSTNKGQRAFLMTLKKETDHGVRFSYKDSETEVLTWMMEKQMNKPFAELFSELIWSKMGAEYDAYIACDGLGSPVSSAGFNVVLRDFARIGQLYLNGGKWGDNQLIPAAFVNDIAGSADSEKLANSPSANYYPKGTAYNNYFWLPGGHEGAFLAYGYQGQYLYIHPKFNVVIAKFSTYPEGDDFYLRDTDWRGFYAICKSIR